MKHICNNCKKTTELTHNFEYVTFVCPHCKQVHRHTEKEQNETIAGNYTSKENYTLSLKVGDVGTLLSDTYQVTGALVKRTSRELWNEYSLMNVETKAIKYLIELDGTWAIEEEIEPTHPNYYYYVTQSYNNKYSLYQHEQDVRLLTAEGFFDHIISQKPYQLYDYISPPYIISVEKRKNETWYFAGQRVLSD
ncbi:MAG TPA: DUF4178 domain-containing protein, partial [Chitinophagales bacterium]|nr:DUF4178 domain-containing protein [Chitinophagales bacterium]